MSYAFKFQMQPYRIYIMHEERKIKKCNMWLQLFCHKMIGQHREKQCALGVLMKLFHGKTIVSL